MGLEMMIGNAKAKRLRTERRGDWKRWEESTEEKNTKERHGGKVLKKKFKASNQEREMNRQRRERNRGRERRVKKMETIKQ